MKFSAEITRTLSADTVVVGGGTAGVYSAIAAARTGAKVVLLEKNSILGGTMTVGGVNFPGLFFAWGKPIIDGPCMESIRRTLDAEGLKMPKISFKPEHHYDEQISLNRFILTAVLFEMCAEAGVRVICGAMPSAVSEKEDGIILTATDKNGLFSITAKTAVDATGDANLTALAGFPLEKSEIQQPATLQNRISDYSMTNSIAEEIKAKISSASLPECITAEKLIHYLNIKKLDMHIPCVDADTSAGRTALEKDSFSQTLCVYRFLKSIKGLENIKISLIAEETGVRESTRIVGNSTITADDYISGTFYPDSVCYAFYPIDLHVMHGIEQQFHKEGIVSKIPYSALIPKNSKRILCAGRCISSDTYANSAVRVEAVCMATGQAAGCAAARAALTGKSVDSVPYTDICAALNSIGAIVPKK